MVIGADYVSRLVAQLESIQRQALDDKRAVISLYPSTSPEHDARVTAFAKFRNVLVSTQLALIFVSSCLLDSRWWEVVPRAPMSESDKKACASEFLNFTKVGFVHGLFSSVESSLRLFLRALDPVACKGGMAEFRSVYDCLFRSRLTIAPADGIELLDLLRLVRNTVHNNGVYFGPHGSVTVKWQTAVFEFRQEIAVDFVTWEFLIRVSDALRTLLRQVVEDPRLRALTVTIDDPFSRR